MMGNLEKVQISRIIHTHLQLRKFLQDMDIMIQLPNAYHYFMMQWKILD